MKKVKCPYCKGKNTQRTSMLRYEILIWCICVFGLICLVGFIDAGWWIASIIDLLFVSVLTSYLKKNRKYYVCKDCEKVFDK